MRISMLSTILLFLLPIAAASSFQQSNDSNNHSKINKAAEDIWQRSLPGKVANVSPSYNTRFESKLSAKKKGKKEISNEFTIGTASLLDSSRRGVVKNGVSTALVTPLLTEGFSRLGSYFLRFDKLHYPQVPTGVTEITIVFHGSNGVDENTDNLMANLERSDMPYSFLFDWSLYSKNLVQAAYNGERIGKEVAKRLPARIRKIHIIGISVGAMAADACVVQLRADRARKMYIQETLLDPLCARGVLDLEYGEREFGKEADYAQQILNTDDPVPFTNLPCAKCAVLDITPCRPTEIFGHDWPLVYYYGAGGAGSKGGRRRDVVFGFVDDDKKLGRGVVVTVKK